MSRQSASISARQRRSQRLMREKAARKKRQELIRCIGICAGCFLAVALLSGGVWAWRSGALMRHVNTTITGMYQLTAKAGFSVQSLYLEGRDRTPMDEIEKALGVKRGDPILALDLTDMRDRLQAIKSIKFAAVERALPGTLYVRIIEREPVALWQHDGVITPVDDTGTAMNGITPRHRLPLIIGDGAPQHLTGLIKLLASEPELARRFAVATWVGDRRWNIRLKNGENIVEIELPEDAPDAAWKKLATLEDSQKLLDRDIKVIDMRIEGRMFIRLGPDSPDKTSTARET
ncbi:MAG: FtsQ-type POTRA domain-containing protein [Pseudomonadota bacterium]|nr:FtsQ-type POTRA domain-containing protein [Pseudomonadota bacterium]